MTSVIGIDFGTTNSVVSLLGADGRSQTARFAVGAAHLDVFRSILCFWTEEGRGRTTLRREAGPAAIAAYLDDPLDARLIMSMKTYLAQKSFTQTRLFGRIFTLEDLVGLFLRALLEAAGEEVAASLADGAKVVVGRPVRFAGEFADDDLGEARLRGAFAAAGMADIDVAFEPEGAGYRFSRTLNAPANVLIGDFGGGTSDFSVLRFEPGRERTMHALAHGGIGVAGDALDYRIIDAVITPLLGKGDTYRVPGMGTTDLPVPPEYFSSFARWHLLSLMRTPQRLAEIADVAGKSKHPERLRALIALIEDERGYELYQVVSAAKAALTGADRTLLRFQHRGIDIAREITRAEFEGWIAKDLARIGAVVDRVIAQAGLEAADIGHVFLTGGTSFVPAIRQMFVERFGDGRLTAGGEFVSVAEGLALIGRDRQVMA